MRRSITILAACLLILVALAPGAAAQDQPMVDHPAVGAWMIEPVAMEPPELFTAAADGIVVNAGPDGTGYGAWASTGDHTADVTFLSPMVDPEAGFLGFVTIRASVEVADDGQRFSGTWTAEFPADVAEAMGMPAGELGPSDVSGVRIVVDPMGEAVAPMPEMDEAPAE